MRNVPQNPAATDLHRFRDDGSIPNNPDLPLVVYRGACAGAAGQHRDGRPEEARARAFEEAFGRNGWQGMWRDGVYAHHHYHSNAHEALGVAGGEATIRFGGENGSTVAVRAGDLVVVPAGVGHKRIAASGDFLVVGAYPPGQQPDMCTGKPGEHEGAARRIAEVPLPASDPFYGEDGPLLRFWRGGKAGAGA